MAYGAPAFVDFVQDLQEPPVASSPDIAPLANGGFAVIGFRNGHINAAVYDSAGNRERVITPIAGDDGAVVQLNDGNLAIVSEAGPSLSFTILDPETGGTVIATTPVSIFSGRDADVTALQGGGFAVAHRVPFSPTDGDLYVEIWSNQGVFVNTITVDNSVLNDGDISIATLDNGNLAVAWTRTDNNTGNTTVMYAVYEPDGDPAVVPTAVTTADSEINRNPAISAADGGFAIAFETRAAPTFTIPSSVDIMVKTYDLTGVAQTTILLTNAGIFLGDDDDGSNDSDPYIGRAPDGNLVVSYTTYGDNPGTHFDVIKGNDSIATNIIGGGGSSSVATFFGTGQIAVFDIQDGALTGQHFFGNRDGSGDGAADVAVGDDFFDIMNGGGGNDTLSGGRNNDEVKGDAGADTLHGDDGNDLVNGNGDTGSDTSPDSLFGDAGNDTILGAGGNDTLNGGDGDDSLDGQSGSDVMRGGRGNDFYRVNVVGEQTIETVAGEAGGVDTVISSVSRTLGANLENLTLTGSALNGTGNALANDILANKEANLLRGFGNDDTLNGGAGNDTLNGGTGLDAMVGGTGSDVFYVDDTNDIVIEGTPGAAGGTDTVFSTAAAFTLATNVEILRLQASAASGKGNAGPNSLFGNANANLLEGLGGADTIEGRAGADTLAGGNGNDTLTGGAHADVFRFTTALAGADRITDFNRNVDRFDLSGGSFSALNIAGADTILTHNGGTIRIAGVNNLTLAQWNALVLPGGGGRAVQDDSGGFLAFAGFHEDLAHFRNDMLIFAPGDYIAV